MTDKEIEYGAELAHKVLSFAFFCGTITGKECKTAIEKIFGKEVAERLEEHQRQGRMFDAV